MNTPTLNKMIEIQEQSQLCGEFLDWLLSKYTMYDKKMKRESPFMDVMRDYGDYINKEKLLAEFFDIDLEEAEREKKQLLQVEQNKHKPHHCKLCGSYIEEDNLSVCNKCASEYQLIDRMTPQNVKVNKIINENYTKYPDCEHRKEIDVMGVKCRSGFCDIDDVECDSSNGVCRNNR